MEQGALHTLAKGARQLVVQEALDTMGALGSYESQFTPTTYVGMSEPLAGAVISTCVQEARVIQRASSACTCSEMGLQQP